MRKKPDSYRVINGQREGQRRAERPAKPEGKAKHEKKAVDRKDRLMEQEAKPEDSFVLEGRNAVLEALNAGRPFNTLLVRKGGIEGTVKLIVAMARDTGAVVKEMTKEKLDQISETGKHQGVIAYASAHEYATVDDIFATAESRGEKPFIIIADGVTDPRNLGAIIRSAHAAGAHGLIIPQRRSAALTPVAARASAGAISHLLVARCGNVSQLIAELKSKDVWVAAADMAGEPIWSARDDIYTDALAICVGGEDVGVKRLVREKADFLIGVPMRGVIGSLNVSVAAAVIMFEVMRRRGAS